jgi:uncharacterized membrane protein YoaK (UPF0700 family)
MTAIDTRATVPLLLSFNAGFVDAAGFLALQGLFTAHVTGNFVTLGASLALGTSGAVAKLLALPVFCAVVMATRLIDTALSKRSAHAFEILIGLKILFLMAGAVLAIHLGPFHDGDSGEAIVTGMLLVAAMAIQNALHRIHLGSAPPSTVMTGTTTQIMLDFADRLYAPKGPRDQSSRRFISMTISVVIFATGCGAAALSYVQLGVWCFVVPPAVAALLLIIRLVEAPKSCS